MASGLRGLIGENGLQTKQIGFDFLPFAQDLLRNFGENIGGTNFLQTRFEVQQLKFNRLRQISRAFLQKLRDLRFLRGNDFGGGGRRRRAKIRDKIRNRKIGFVTDGGNHRNQRIANRPRDSFVIKRPQIFHRAAAAPDD